MNAKLARALVQRGVIRQGTIIEAYQSARGLSCVCDSHKLMTFAVVAAKAANDAVAFETIGTDQVRYRIPSEFVQTLDGMMVKRVAASHRLTEDGNELAPRRKKDA